jgi:cardiolipin synthase
MTPNHEVTPSSLFVESRFASTWGRTDWVRRRRPLLLSGHQLSLLPGGEALFAAMTQAMDAAQFSIHLETYIFDFQGTPLLVAEALERAARRGVIVRLVVDGIGTGAIPDAWQTRLNAAGVHTRVFSPAGTLGLVWPHRWSRLHRKLCVIDGVLGFCGGINLLDDHIDPNMGDLAHPRFDFAVRCTGPLVSDISDTMLTLWWRMQAMRQVKRREFKAAWEALCQTQAVGDFAQWVLPQTLWAHGSKLHHPSTPERPPPVVNDAVAALVLRDNLWHRTDIEKAYLKAIGEAQHDILLANAYFVPGRKLRRALIRAAQRGVTVRVLLQGKYETFMQYHAARPVFKQLLDAGIDIRAYAPSALHAKVAVIDSHWATVGSSNLDPLSLLLAREANIITTDPRFSQDLHHRLTLALEHGATAIDHEALKARPWHERVLDRIAFGLMRLALFLSRKRY